MLKISIIGKPNVGKTTIFNKLSGTIKGIVLDVSGVTRDRNEIILNNFEVPVKLIDTAGLELSKKEMNLIENNMKKQTLLALEEADIVFFVIDGSNEILNEDLEIVNLLRSSGKEFVILANKVDKKTHNLDRISNLNINIIKLSAEHNIGLNLLTKYIKNQINELNLFKEETDEKNNQIIKVAIIGRPNAGKSTLINKMLQEERLIVDHIAGTTRDSIHSYLNYRDFLFEIIDTAGIRKRSVVKEKVEELSVYKSFNALEASDVTILMMDVEVALEAQDLILARRALDMNKILILCFNKWDKVSQEMQKDLLEKIKHRISSSIPDVKAIPFFTLSALNENSMNSILNEIIILHQKWSSKVKSKLLNGILHDQDLVGKFPFKIKYISQVNTKPPIFTLHIKIQDINQVKSDQIRALKNIIANKLNLNDIPIVVKLLKCK